MKILLKYIVIGLYLNCCSLSESDLAGTYVKVPSINTIDSLFIYTDSPQPTKVHHRMVYKYKQVLYNKKTSKLLFENKGTWWLDDKKIEFMNFYFDVDNNPNDYSYSSEAIKNSVTFFSTELDGRNIIVERNVFYVKVK